MSNERADEFLSWRGRLTPPDALPEQDLEDRELSWQRLAERLAKKPRRRGIAWWIAAACLIFALFPATFFFRDRPIHRNRVAQRTPARRAPVTQPQPLTQPQPVTPTQSEPAPTAQRHPASTNHRSSLPPNPPTDTPPPPPGAPPTPALAHTEAPAKAADSLLASIAPPASRPPAVTPRRPLRIVYLNELNKDPGTSAVANRQPAFLHFGTAAATADWTISQQNISIIKINISSPNH